MKHLIVAIITSIVSSLITFFVVSRHYEEMRLQDTYISAAINVIRYVDVLTEMNSGNVENAVEWSERFLETQANIARSCYLDLCKDSIDPVISKALDKESKYNYVQIKP